MCTQSKTQLPTLQSKVFPLAEELGLKFLTLVDSMFPKCLECLGNTLKNEMNAALDAALPSVASQKGLTSNGANYSSMNQVEDSL